MDEGTGEVGVGGRRFESLTVGMTIHLHASVHFGSVNFTICKLYLNT